MSGFTLIGDRELVNPEWQLIVEPGGIDFETGGTLRINVSIDPEMEREVQMETVSEAHLETLSSNPEILARMKAQVKPRVMRSDRVKLVLALTFGSNGEDGYFNWIFDRRGKEVIVAANKAADAIATNAPSGEQLLAEILQNIVKLDCFEQVNRPRFKGLRLSADSSLVELLNLQNLGEFGGNIVFHQKEFA